MTSEFVRFFREALEAKELKITQAPEFIERETGYTISVQQAYEFLDEKRESCPSSAMVKVWERAFRVNLAPRYYGADKAFAKKDK
jgi:hypothetical protein